MGFAIVTDPASEKDMTSFYLVRSDGVREQVDPARVEIVQRNGVTEYLLRDAELRDGETLAVESAPSPSPSTAPAPAVYNRRRDHFWPPLNRAERRKRARVEARTEKRLRKQQQRANLRKEPP